MSYTTTATLESRMYEGIKLLNRSCPAVSQSCNRTVRSSRYMVWTAPGVLVMSYHIPAPALLWASCL